MAKTVKHYNVDIWYKKTQDEGIGILNSNQVVLPDYLSKEEPIESDDAFNFITTENERIIIMKSIVGLFKYKPIYETET